MYPIWRLIVDGKLHSYEVKVTWTGNEGTGTGSYRGYSRNHEVTAGGKPVIAGSSDPAFRGDPARWNPEDLLVASLSACHKLWYLGLCAQAGVTVLSYEDNALVMLRPKIVIDAQSDPDVAAALHHKAHAMCFIARSVNFPVGNEPEITVQA
jgi:organic hydroperoxide reductase OsmC/OhrA